MQERDTAEQSPPLTPIIRGQPSAGEDTKKERKRVGGNLIKTFIMRLRNPSLIPNPLTALVLQTCVKSGSRAAVRIEVDQAVGVGR